MQPVPSHGAEVPAPIPLPRGVIKRDGSFASFDSEKIRSAIQRAGAATGEFDGSESQILAAQVVKVLRLAWKAGAGIGKSGRNINMKNSLEKLFNPKSVAVLGASEDLDRIGGLTLHFLLRHGYKGRIYPVNPKYQMIRGLRCHAAVTEIPGPVDLVLIGIPRAAVFDALGQCAARKTPFAILFSAGYAEMGPSGRAEQQKLKDFARRAGMRIVGPNCIGIINAHDRVAASFVSGLEARKS